MAEYLGRRIFRDIGGKTVCVSLWDTGRMVHHAGSYYAAELRYRLTHGGVEIFYGVDYSVGCCTAIDSDDAFHGIVGFLSLRPGDTDPDYFADYTPSQLEWAETYGEELACRAEERWGAK